jgi:putative GTP pyrophosphokinase
VPDPDAVRMLVEEYVRYARTVLHPNRDRLRTMFRSWKEPSYWERPDSVRLPAPSPIQRGVSRVKRVESVVDKLLRRPQWYPDGLTMNSIPLMYDTLGARIVVYFLSSFPLIDRQLRQNDVLELHPTEPARAFLSRDLADRLGLNHLQIERKESGYASLHYTVRFREAALPDCTRPWFELQVRTLVEDAWSEIEHILGYKPDKDTTLGVKKRFRIIANELTAIDEHFDLIYDELSRYQQQVKYEKSDKLNAENLPAVLSQLGISCAQSEIDGLLKLLASRGFDRVTDLSEGAAGDRIDVIRNTYRVHCGRAPTDFETVAAIAAIKGLQGERMPDVIKTQIDILEAWMGIKRDLKKDEGENRKSDERPDNDSKTPDNEESGPAVGGL